MPRVKQVTAAKDYPEFGIVKGQKHYHWKRKTGPYTSQEYRQVEPPRIEQLTSSEYKIAMHNIEQQRSEIGSYEDVTALAEAVRDLGSEQQGKFDNMPEGLQQGDTGQTLEQQAQALESAAEELDAIAEEWETALNEHASAVEEYDAAMIDYNAAMETGDFEEDDEPEEPDDPGEFDEAEYLDRVNDVALES